MVDLKEFQAQLFEILKEFDRVCRKNDIKYSLAYGTMLGAIRHKGFIPWDDDVDVMMDRENFEKFCKIAPEELGPDFFFQSKETEPKYPYNICRIRKNNTAMIYNEWRDSGIHLGIYIDIYPIDRIPDNKIAKMIKYFFIILLTPVRISRNKVIAKNGGAKFNSTIKNIVCSIAGLLPKKLCDKIENHFIVRHNNKLCKKSGIICEGGTLINTPKDMKPFDTAWLEDYVEVDFEDMKFMSFKNPEKFLEHWYGDFMQLPPEEDRVMFHHPDVFDTENSYEKYI